MPREMTNGFRSRDLVACPTDSKFRGDLGFRGSRGIQGIRGGGAREGQGVWGVHGSECRLQGLGPLDS